MTGILGSNRYYFFWSATEVALGMWHGYVCARIMLGDLAQTLRSVCYEQSMYVTTMARDRNKYSKTERCDQM